jgi:hypothetical protein
MVAVLLAALMLDLGSNLYPLTPKSTQPKAREYSISELTLSCGMVAVLLAALMLELVPAGLAPAPVGAPPGFMKGV